MPLQEQYPEANDKDQLLTVKSDQNSYQVVGQGAQPSKTEGKKTDYVYCWKLLLWTCEIF